MPMTLDQWVASVLSDHHRLGYIGDAQVAAYVDDALASEAIGDGLFFEIAGRDSVDGIPATFRLSDSYYTDD